MQIVSLIFTIMLITRFRVWFFREIFSRFSLHLTNKLAQLWYAGLLVGALALYEWAGAWFGRTSIKVSLDWSAGLVFWLWCGGLAWILLLMRWFQKERKIWFQILIGLLLLGAILLMWRGILGWELGQMIRILPYYLILAHTEEFFKFSLAQLEEGRDQKPTVSSLLAFSLVVGISFALVENMLALWVMLVQGSQILTGFLWGRGVVAVMIHILATGSIAFLHMKLRALPWYLRYSLALSFGVLIHVVYNLGMVYGRGSLSFLLAVGGFFGLTYLLYHMDELYLPDEE